MHYKQKNTAKEDSGSFLLSEAMLAKLDMIASFYNKSRAQVVEFILLHKEFGNEKAKKRFLKPKAKRYHQKKKKIQAKKGTSKSPNKNEQGTAYEQKCLFDYECE